MKLIRWLVAATILVAATRVSAGNAAPPAGNTPSPDATEDGKQQGSPSSGGDYPNVIVPHDTEEQKRVTGDRRKASTPAEAAGGALPIIELVDVGEVVAIPSSAQQGMFPEREQLDDRTHFGVMLDGKTLATRVTGKWTGWFMSKDRKFAFATVDASVTTKGRTGTRPTLKVTRWDSTGVSQDWYDFAVKSVRPDQRGIEPKMELRGGIKSVADGVQPGTFDVYLEITLPGNGEKDAKKILASGTFEAAAITANRHSMYGNSAEGPPVQDGRDPGLH